MQYNKMIILLVAAISLPLLVGCKPGEDKAIELAQKEIAVDMKDLDSAKFRYTRMVNSEDLKDGSVGAMVCGQVNAKNAFGAYGGNQKFTVMLTMEPQGVFSKAVTYKVISKHIFEDDDQANSWGYTDKCGEDN